MNMKSFTPIAMQECPLARGISLIGDKWSMLILREVLYGVSRFDQMQQDMDISRTLLSQRLRHLVKNGILRRVPYRQPKSRTRFEYVLTPYGESLKIPFGALLEWGKGEKSPTGSPLVFLHHRASGERVHIGFITESGQIVGQDHDVRIRIPRHKKTSCSPAER